MNRVWLFIPMLIVSLAGSPWLADPARGDDGNSCPSADTCNNGRDVCPCLERMRAYGECQWYCDQEREHHRGTMPAVTEATTDSEPCCPAMAETEVAEEATATTEAPAACPAIGPADCWYDGATDSYHDYEFSNTEMVCEETDETDTEAVETCAPECMDEACEETDETDAEAAETYAAEAMDQACEETVETSSEAAETYAVESMDEATEDDWNGSYEFPSETAASEPSSSEIDWVEDLPEENPANEPATYGDANESEMGDTQTTEATESNEEVMEGTQEQGAAQAETNELSIIGPSGEYESSYGVEPYYYEYHPGSDNWPDPTWEDNEPSAELVEGGDSGAITSPSASSAAAEFDGEIILSLARTLDRVGVTLQSISRYLTEMATSDLARRPSDSLER